VVAKEAAQRKITIIISVSDLKSVSGKKQALYLEKIIQNILVCRRAKCELKIASLAHNKKETTDEKARRDLGMSLGMSSFEAKGCVRF